MAHSGVSVSASNLRGEGLGGGDAKARSQRSVRELQALLKPGTRVRALSPAAGCHAPHLTNSLLCGIAFSRPQAPAQRTGCSRVSVRSPPRRPRGQPIPKRA